MRKVIDNRIEEIERINDYDKMMESRKPERMKSRQCEFVSLHPVVSEYDKEYHNDIKELERIDIEQEIINKTKTYFKSYAEIKVCSKISTTNWDDSFNLTWETLI